MSFEFASHWFHIGFDLMEIQLINIWVQKKGTKVHLVSLNSFDIQTTSCITLTAVRGVTESTHCNIFKNNENFNHLEIGIMWKHNN